MEIAKVANDAKVENKQLEKQKRHDLEFEKVSEKHGLSLRLHNDYDLIFQTLSKKPIIEATSPNPYR